MATITDVKISWNGMVIAQAHGTTACAICAIQPKTASSRLPSVHRADL